LIVSSKKTRNPPFSNVPWFFHDQRLRQIT
jgi:hypothetical protein